MEEWKRRIVELLELVDEEKVEFVYYFLLRAAGQQKKR